MSFKEGSKVLYCKVAGDKSTEEVVTVVAVQEETKSATILIPSLNRERDTTFDRLMPIVEEKTKISKFFGEMKLKLPYIEKPTKLVVKYRQVANNNAYIDVTSKVLGAIVSPPDSALHSVFGDPYPGHLKELHVEMGKFVKIFPEGTSVKVVCDWIKKDNDVFDIIGTVPIHREADEVLLDNQRILMNKVNALQESLKVLTKRSPDTDLKAKVDTQAEEIAELRRLNTSLLINQQAMAKEIKEMRDEMLRFKTSIAVPVQESLSPLHTAVYLGTKL